MIDLLKLRVRFLIIMEDQSVWRSFRALVLNHASDLGRRSTSCHSAPGFHLMLLRSVCFRDSNTSIDDGCTIRMALSFLESSLLTEYTFLPIDVLIFALKEQEHDSPVQSGITK